MTQNFVLDKASILDRLGGDEDIFAMMVDLYLQDADSAIQALGAALASADSNALMREAHTAKGLLATFSDDLGADAAFVVEQQARTGDLTGLQGAVATVQERMRGLAVVLRSAPGSVG